MNISYQIYQLFWNCLDWLYPPHCAGCNKSGTRWCKECQEKVIEISNPICPCCGEPQVQGVLCLRCQSVHPQYRALRSWAVFQDPIRQALHRLKYKRDISLGETLAIPLIDRLQKLAWSIDVVVPIPLSIARMSQRGYNQASLLARPLALGMDLKYQPNIIRRIRDTKSQVGLSLDERRKNVSDAFQADAHGITGKNILIIDDIATTGATLNACAASFMAQGVKDVYCLTVARAVNKYS